MDIQQLFISLSQTLTYPSQKKIDDVEGELEVQMAYSYDGESNPIQQIATLN